MEITSMFDMLFCHIFLLYLSLKSYVFFNAAEGHTWIMFSLCAIADHLLFLKERVINTVFHHKKYYEKKYEWNKTKLNTRIEFVPAKHYSFNVLIHSLFESLQSDCTSDTTENLV